MLAEWRRTKRDWSPSQYLAAIQRESGGRIDAVSSAGARGLGQVMPATLAWYRSSTGDPASDYESNGETQIRVGSWVYGRGIARARSTTLDPACPDPHGLRFALADMAYAVGWGSVQKALAALGRPPKSLEEIEAACPVPLAGNRPYVHARAVAALARADTLGGPYVITGWPSDSSVFDPGDRPPVADTEPEAPTTEHESGSVAIEVAIVAVALGVLALALLAGLR